MNQSEWTDTTIGEQCLVIAGQSPQGKFYNETGTGLPFYQGKKEFGEKFIKSPKKWTSHTTKEALAGDILMSVRAPVGPVNFSTEQVCIGRGLAAIRVGNDIDKEFLFYALLSKKSEISGNEGAVFASINKQQIESIRLSLPPLHEQKRIVAILDKAFAAIDQATANARKNLANARELFESYLNNVFTQKGEGWEEKKLSEILAIQPRNGWSPPAKNHSEKGTPVLTLSAVTGFKFNKSKLKHTSAFTRKEAHYWVENGDLFISRSNTPELVGHVAVCSGIEKPTIYPDLIMKMRVNQRIASTRFVYYQLRSRRLRKLIMNSAQGANPTMKKINKGIVQGLPISLPGISQQINISEKIDSIFHETQSLETNYKKKLSALAKLKQSILQKAFSGELTAHR